MIADRSEVVMSSRGWGFVKQLTQSKNYCGKLLYFVKDKRCNMHYHDIKEETLYIHNGKISAPTDMIYSEMESIVLRKGDSFHIPAHRVHQIIAMEDSEIYEFASGNSESDSQVVLKGD